MSSDMENLAPEDVAKAQKIFAAKWLSVILVPLIIMLLPTNEIFNSQIRLFLAVTVCGIMLFAMELVNTLVSSVLLMFAYGLFGVAPRNAILMPWTIDVPWMTLGALILVAVVQRTTILQRMAYWAVIKVGGSYRGIIFAITTIAIVARIFLQGTMACISVIFIAYGICLTLNLGKSRASAGIMVMAVIAYMDANFFIYSPDFISVLYNMAGKVTDVTVSYPQFFMDNAIYVLDIYLVAWVVSIVTRPEKPLNGRAFFVEKQKALAALTSAEKKIIFILVALVLFLFTSQYHGVPMVYGFIGAALILFLPGFNVGTSEDIKSVNYPVLFFIVACLSIGNAANAVGLGAVISKTVVPLLQNIGEMPFLFIIYILAAGMNFLMTPLAEMAALGLPLAQICSDLHFNIYPMFYSFYQGTAQLLFPYETAVYLVAFSLGLIRIKDFLYIMIVKFVINTVFLVTAGFGWWNLIGLL